MKCPVCNTVDLQMSERNGVEIDYCPQCRGVWLDRGELDKIIERASADEQRPPQSVPTQSTGQRREDPRYEYDDDDDDYRRGSHEGGRKKKSFLGDLFDF